MNSNSNFSRSLVISISLLGLTIIITTILAYHWLGGFGLPFSQDQKNLADFGTYFGGVAGTLFSFLALLTLVATLNFQFLQFRLENERQLAREQVSWLSAIYNDICLLTNSQIPCIGAGNSIVFADILDTHNVPASIDNNRLKVKYDELVRLLQQYCEAIAVYRENSSPLFDIQILIDRGARLLDQVKTFAGLSHKHMITFEFCDMHLKGETKRMAPEAMTRKTRNY